MKGIRGCGKSTVARVLVALIGDDKISKIDLDEQSVEGGEKYSKFYEKVLTRMESTGGLWLVDKLGSYADDHRRRFLVRLWLIARKTVVLNLGYDDAIIERRICFARFVDRSDCHFDPANSEEDIYMNLEFEQTQRRRLTRIESYGLTEFYINIRAKTVHVVIQAIEYLNAANIIQKDKLGFPLANLVYEALVSSLRVECSIGSNRDFDLGRIERLEGNLEKVVQTPLPFEDMHPDNPRLLILKEEESKFFKKIGIQDQDIVHDVLDDTIQQNLFVVFNQSTARGVKQSEIRRWLKGESYDRSLDRAAAILDRSAAMVLKWLCDKAPQAVEILVPPNDQVVILSCLDSGASSSV